ncbi:MAG: DUF192 domain-containing protein [Spirochaetaceae bacterium]|nr:DUF192 domain-containing protein [Spirochaetaceae bacterium]
MTNVNVSRRILALSILCLFITFISCRSAASNERDIITINGNTLNIEIAETEEQRRVGLMHRKSLDRNSGMLFVFESDRILSFWMKNTYIPLSIAFISSDGTIREIRDMTPLSRESVVSRNHVRYALEVNQGYFEEKNITVGDRVILPERFRR